MTEERLEMSVEINFSISWVGKFVHARAISHIIINKADFNFV